MERLNLLENEHFKLGKMKFYRYDRKGAIEDFLEYELSYTGQDVVEAEGFFPIPAEYKEFNAKAGL